MSQAAIAFVALVLVPAAVHTVDLVDESEVENMDFIGADSDDRALHLSVLSDGEWNEILNHIAYVDLEPFLRIVRL